MDRAHKQYPSFLNCIPKHIIDSKLALPAQIDIMNCVKMMPPFLVAFATLFLSVWRFCETKGIVTISWDLDSEDYHIMNLKF